MFFTVILNFSYKQKLIFGDVIRELTKKNRMRKKKNEIMTNIYCLSVLGILVYTCLCNTLYFLWCVMKTNEYVHFYSFKNDKRDGIPCPLFLFKF